MQESDKVYDILSYWQGLTFKKLGGVWNEIYAI